MTTYTVDLTKPQEIIFAPSSLAIEVAQNIRTILSTPLGTAPLSRFIGLDYEMVDLPYPVAKARLVGTVTAAIAEQETRAQVEEVLLSDMAVDTMTGCLPVIVRYTLVEEGGDSNG